MTDASAANATFNEALAEENERLNSELAKYRALIERPVTVNIQSAEASALKKLVEYLPKFGELAVNTATIAGEMIKAAKRQSEEHDALMRAIVKQDHTQRRIAAALERAHPIPDDEQEES